MTDMELFDQLIESCVSMEMSGHDMIQKARILQDGTHRRFGIECHNREPGFPCWTIDGVSGYFNTPREALQAKEKR